MSSLGPATSRPSERDTSIKILLSYRRQDSAAITGRICDRLVNRFGRQSVFMDVDSIPFGTDFRKHIDAEMARCDAFLAIIGREWTGQDASLQSSRILDPQDPIRIEIASALKLDVPIIPVLVNGASMPPESDLPDEIKPLSYLNAVEVSSGRDFHVHAQRLIKAIEGLKSRRNVAARGGRDPARMRRLGVLVSAFCGLTAAAALLVLEGDGLWSRWKQAPAATVARAPATYCDDIRRVIASTDTDFASLKTSAMVDGKWQTSLQLPGYSGCSIDKMSDLAFDCQADEVHGDVAAAMAARVDQTRACLDDQWTGPATLGAARSFHRPSSGDNIILMPLPSMAPNGTPTVRTSIMIYRHASQPVEAVEDAQVPKDFCPDLHKLVTAAVGGFDGILGYRRSTYWMSKQQVKGFSSCTIDAFSDDPKSQTRRYVSCTLEPFQTEPSAKAALGSLIASASACLGDGWSGETRLDYRNLPRWEAHSPTDPVNVELRMRSSGGVWDIHLDVNMD